MGENLMAIDLLPKRKSADPLRHDPEALVTLLLDHELLAEVEDLKAAERSSRELAARFGDAKGRARWARAQVDACSDVAKLAGLRLEAEQRQAECDRLEAQANANAALIEAKPDLERRVRLHFSERWPEATAPFAAKSQRLLQLLEELAEVYGEMEHDRAAADLLADRFNASNFRFRRPLPWLFGRLLETNGHNGKTALQDFIDEWKREGWLR
jgi:hypothetical protein